MVATAIPDSEGYEAWTILNIYTVLFIFSNVNNSSTLEDLFGLCKGQLVLVVPNEMFIKVKKEKL